MWISPSSYSWKETLLDILRGKQCSELSTEVLFLFSPALNALLTIFRVKHSCLTSSGQFLVWIPDLQRCPL